MANVNMADLFAGAEAAGFSGADLGHGAYDVKVKRTSVKDSPGGERLLVTYEALSGKGTVLDGQTFNPDNKGLMFHWFRFLGKFNIGKEFFASNPTITVEQIGQTMVSAAEQGQTFRIRYQAQENNDVYSEVIVLGPATGEADAPKVVAAAPPVPAPAQVAPPVPAVADAAAPTPPWEQ